MNRRKSDNDEHAVLNDVVYPPVGHCIYCGATENLSKEHILPFGLSGSAILPKASCQKCTSITGKFEQEILRGSFWPVRVFRDLKSRSKHKDAPSHIDILVNRDGRFETVQLPIDEAPIFLPFPVFPLPTHLSKAQTVNGITVSGHVTVQFGADPGTIGKALGGSAINITATMNPREFALMIAKIGYSYAYAEGTLGDIDGESYVLPSVLGAKDEIGRWVGTLTKPITIYPTMLHRIEIHRDFEKGLLFAEVQLFADSSTPSYGVILGKLRANLNPPEP